MQDSSHESVQAITVSALVDRFLNQRCDLLKIDIEGAEVSVFSEGIDAWMNRVGVILVEAHGPKAEQLILDVANQYRLETRTVGEKIMMWRKQ